MSELTPHPVFRLPTAEQARAMPLEDLNEWLARRDVWIENEKRDPFTYGFESEIWNLVDDLLVDGNKVVLDLTRIAKLFPDGQAPLMVDVPKELEGAPEIWIPGANRSSKSEYAGKKIMKVLYDTKGARTWSFADTGPISIARQQPIFWRYMPLEVKRLAADTGKARQGVTLNVSYKQKTGFAEQSFVLPNGAQHWFKNYEQDLQNVEGDQLDAIWLDELRNIELLRTLRGRTIDRGGLIIVTFTSIDENYTAVVNEYERGARTVLEVDAELLPIKRPRGLSADSLGPDLRRSGEEDSENLRESAKSADENDLETIGYEKVPRVKVAGPGNDGNLRANIVFFHITDNPYFGYQGAMQRRRAGAAPLFGKERFYRAYRNATRGKILSRVYGILQAASSQQFPKFSDAVHVIEPDTETAAWHELPFRGSMRRTQLGDDMATDRSPPAGGVYTGNGRARGTRARIPGHKRSGPVDCARENGRRRARRCAEKLGFGLDAYKAEIARLEGWPEQKKETETQPEAGFKRVPGLARAGSRINSGQPGRLKMMDEGNRSRSAGWIAATARCLRARGKGKTLIEQCGELDLEFKAASGKEIVEGVTLINDMLDYDKELPLGQWSPQLGRLNSPKLYVSSRCPNLIYAMREWTGKDGNKGACKDWIDLLRYAALAELSYIGEGAYTWEKG